MNPQGELSVLAEDALVEGSGYSKAVLHVNQILVAESLSAIAVNLGEILWADQKDALYVVGMRKPVGTHTCSYTSRNKVARVVTQIDQDGRMMDCCGEGRWRCKSRMRDDDLDYTQYVKVCYILTP